MTKSGCTNYRIPLWNWMQAVISKNKIDQETGLSSQIVYKLMPGKNDEWTKKNQVICGFNIYEVPPRNEVRLILKYSSLQGIVRPSIDDRIQIPPQLVLASLEQRMVQVWYWNNKSLLKGILSIVLKFKLAWWVNLELKNNRRNNPD
jgi:hypothetical protein